jgi:hypothetical protein
MGGVVMARAINDSVEAMCRSAQSRRDLERSRLSELTATRRNYCASYRAAPA